MNVFQAWTHQPIARTLGWSLLHFLWEGALIAGILALLLYLSRGVSSRLRYAFCCLAMLAMPLAFGITAVIYRPLPPPALAIQLHPAPPDDAAAAQSGALPWTLPLRQRIAAVLPWIVPFWMAGVLFFLVRSLGSWAATRRMCRTGVCAAPGDWPARLERLRDRLQLSRPVVLLESCLIDVPVVIGYLRPVILMPVGLLTGFSTDHLEAILIHELAHIRRRDYLLNLLQSFVESVLFYHPAVWWVSHRIRAERENCCDDVVVELNGDARGYAAALATLEHNRWPAQEPALAATGGSLMNRIRRLLQEPEGPRTTAAPVFAASLLIVSLGVAMAGWQSKPSAAPQLQPAPLADSRPQAQPQPEPQAPAIPAPLIAQVKPAPAPEFVTVPDPYRKWMNEDVAYIISDEERSAFKRLETPDEQEHFIEQFWIRRDPTPNTVENEFKQEHYRRIAYTNDHFAARIPGWKTDRGRIYVTFGPPDEIESHPQGGPYQRPPEQGGGTTTTYPFEAWRYRFIEGIGKDVIIEFVDTNNSGDYRMTMDPNEKNALLTVGPGLVTSVVTSTTKPDLASMHQMGQNLALLSVPLTSFGNHRIKVTGVIRTLTGRTTQNFEDPIQGPAPLYSKFIQLQPGKYTSSISVTDLETNTVVANTINFEVK